MAHITKDQWEAIRVRWEEEPVATYESAAKHVASVGGFKPPARATICERAKRENWSKRGQLGNINEAADRIADAFTDKNGEFLEPNKKPNEFAAKNIAAREESESVRAAVKIRHRSEWAELEGFRKTALVAMKAAHESGERSDWIKAKIAADTARANLQALEIKQQGERKAWGLDVHGEEDIVIVNPRKIEV